MTRFFHQGPSNMVRDSLAVPQKKTYETNYDIERIKKTFIQVITFWRKKCYVMNERGQCCKRCCRSLMDFVQCCWRIESRERGWPWINFVAGVFDIFVSQFDEQIIDILWWFISKAIEDVNSFSLKLVTKYFIDNVDYISMDTWRDLVKFEGFYQLVELKFPQYTSDSQTLRCLVLARRECVRGPSCKMKFDNYCRQATYTYFLNFNAVRQQSHNAQAPFSEHSFTISMAKL